MQKYDNANLLFLIDKKFKSKSEFCRVAGISRNQFYNEIQNHKGMKAETILKAAEALKIPPQEIGFYFFAPVM